MSVPRTALVILRLHLGVILLLTVLGKLTRDAPFSGEMLAFLNGVAARRATPAYLGFIREVVLPHPTLFARLVMAGELTAALSLLSGTATRVGAAIAMFLFLNYMLAKGRWFWSPDSQDAAVFFSAFAVLLGAAGRAYGVDAWLARRWPAVPIW